MNYKAGTVNATATTYVTISDIGFTPSKVLIYPLFSVSFSSTYRTMGAYTTAWLGYWDGTENTISARGDTTYTNDTITAGRSGYTWIAGEYAYIAWGE